MPKRSVAPPLALPARGDAAPAYVWLADALRGAILAGQLRPGARLPGTRDLAAQHGLARGTVVTAIEQLRSEGYLDATVGSGTYVARALPDELLRAPRMAARPSAPPARRRRFSAFGRRVRPLGDVDPTPARAFRANQPALDLFPTTLWAQVAGRRLRRASARLLQECDPLGYEPLREAVADYLRASRGVVCTSQQVAIVSGSQEALDLTARVLLDPGDRVCLEDPSYVGVARVFDALGARVVTVPVDDEGLVLQPSRLAGVRLVYAAPAHQFPLGVVMSLPRRLALLDWAQRSGAIVFEDDYDSEYRYAGRPLPALQGLDAHGSVIFAGSFSKVLFPGLRLGYLVLPPDLVERFAVAKSVMNRFTSLPDQAILCDFLVEGHFGRHVRRMREVYAARLAALLAGMRDRLAGLLEASPVEAGLQTTAWLVDGRDDVAAARAAARHGVEIVPLSRYSRGRRIRPGLQLGFAAVDERAIRRGVEALAVALGE
jgi:GntR family transcriptional regulator/MocR family aminotransferase